MDRGTQREGGGAAPTNDARDGDWPAEAAERKYHALIQSAIDGICILEDQAVTLVNPCLCAMMACDADALIGTSFLDLLAPEARKRAASLYRRMTNREVLPQRYETELLTRAGVRLEVQISPSMFEAEGRSLVMIMIHDITGQKKESRVAIENERLEALRAVARAVGNNFSNILNVINNYASSISESVLPKTHTHEASCKILEAAGHATELTKRLLGVARVSVTEAEPRVEPVPLLPSLQRAYALIAPTLRDHGIKFIIHPEVETRYAMADTAQLLDVLMNVILNGADAMPQGGTLQVSLTDREIRATREGDTEPHADYVEMAVTDTGIGMSPEQVSRVFEPFFTTKQDGAAFGLGLPVAQGMVKSWGGWLEIHSTLGKGTCVRILMRRAEPSGTPAGEPEPGICTILVADDHRERRGMMVRVLREDGHTVLEAENGEQALTLFQRWSHDIDLTVLDWIMPGVDGKEALRVIHAHQPECPVLMTSGFSRDYVRSQIRMGGWTFLQQPFSDAQFRVAVHRALQRTAR